MNRSRFIKLLVQLLFALVFLQSQHALSQTPPLSLAGEWRFQLDRNDVGLREQWFTRDLTDRIKLPGILQAQGYGDEISTNTPWVLSLYDKLWFEREDYKAHTRPGNVRVPFVSQPQRHYLGVVDGEARAAFDGDPNTFWGAAGGRGGRHHRTN